MNNLECVTLGGLLHDVGKLVQRGGNERKNHSESGVEFLQQHLKLGEDVKKKVLNCVRYHHQGQLKSAGLKEDDLAYIVCEADNIASGADRRKNENENFGYDLTVPLSSVFNVLNDNKTKSMKNCRHYLRALKEGENINYPIPDSSFNASKDKYLEIREQIIDNFRTRWNEEIEHSAINSILQILEANAGFIPSSTAKNQNPDISLFDHMKLTSALASCIYLYLEDMNVDNYKKWYAQNTRNENCYLLLSGDISGIQGFIYTIASKAALKSLRGRSFYLEMILEHIADEILGNLGLSRANLLYTGGGHFYMLLPNTKKTIHILESAQKKLNSWFLEKYNLGLYLALAWQECSANNFMYDEKKEIENNMGAIYNGLASKLSCDKLNRYDIEQLKDVFSPDSGLYKNCRNTRECTICKTSSGSLKPVGDFNEEDDEFEETDQVCENCKSIIQLGKEILKKSYGNNNDIYFGILSDVPPQEKDRCIELPSLDDTPRFLVVKDKPQIDRDRKGGLDYLRIYSKNRWYQGVSTRLWVGDYSPGASTTEGAITFEELAGNSPGIKRLAVLRADVDDLGSAFSNGFSEKYNTLSRTATLSRQLALFFKFYINKICMGRLQGVNSNEPRQFKVLTKAFGSNSTGTLERKISIVYAGGDDVFVAGAWHDVIEFAVDLNNCFRKFTSEKLTLSAGTGFFHSKYPICQMAELTGKLEEQAKKFGDGAKNAIALFGIDPVCNNDGSKGSKFNHIYHWDEFQRNVCEEKLQTLTGYFNVDSQKTNGTEEKFTISVSFLYRLIAMLRSIELNENIDLARLAYTLARLEPSRKNKQKYDNYKELKIALYNWANNRNRKGEQDGKNHRKQLITAINLLVYAVRDN